jgi:hypothetical protein
MPHEKNGCLKGLCGRAAALGVLLMATPAFAMDARLYGYAEKGVVLEGSGAWVNWLVLVVLAAISLVPMFKDARRY